MKTLYKIPGIIFLLIIVISSNVFAINKSINTENSDSLKLLETYSLFSEYHKNKDYVSALPYGWEVLKINPEKFRKWIFYKMEDALWFVHDSTDVIPELQQSIQDTMLFLYDLAVKYYPEDKAYFESHRAFILEGWIHAPAEQIIAEYEKAIKHDKDLSSYYYNRLGQLYIKNQSDDNDYKTKALDLYTYLSEREPDTQQWSTELEGLVENIEQLVELKKKNWLNNKDDLSKAWKFSSMAMKAEDYEQAIEGLEFLVSKAPETINYWNQLQTAYQKTDQLNEAENALLKLIELDPDSKEHYFNLGIVYSDKGKYSLSRRNYLKASEVGGDWALPIFYEGYLYEKAAAQCKDGLDFEKKIIYKIALDTYKKARRMDPTLQQAQGRLNALSSSVPTQEDYFFRGYKTGDVIPVPDGCPGWIGKSITVP